MTGPAPVLEISGLRTGFTRRGREIVAVDDLNLTIGAGETVALVGESGSGKSVTGLSIMRLLPRGIGRIAAGSIRLHRDDGMVDLIGLDDESMRRVRGAAIGMVFQEPMTSLNPVLTIGDQIGEPLRVHEGLDRDATRNRVLAMLEAVGIPDPRRRIAAYPHELSGGMRQRAMIAMALICRPRLLIADEPTTALDTTIQAQIVELLERLQRELGMEIVNLLRDLQERGRLTMLLISHDLGVVEFLADHVVVLYLGRVMESGPSDAIYGGSRHPYTRALLAAAPSPGRRRRGRRATLVGDIPSPLAPPAGCVFRTRCPDARAACAERVPPLREVSPGHFTNCLFE